MGRATAAATLDAAAAASGTRRSAAGSTAGSAELGRNASAAGTVLGCASARRAHGAAASASRPTATATTAGRRRAACADLGIASRRVSAGCSCARSVVGFSAAGRAGAQPGVDRLGISCGQLAAGGATGAVLERARRGFFVGRTQDRGAGGSSSAIVGRSRGRGRAGRCRVGAFARRAFTARGRLGATGRSGATATRFGDVTGAGRRRRRGGGSPSSRAGCARRIAPTRPAALAAAGTAAARCAGALDRGHDPCRYGSRGGSRIDDVDARVAASATYPAGDPGHGHHGRPDAAGAPRDARRRTAGGAHHRVRS